MIEPQPQPDTPPDHVLHVEDWGLLDYAEALDRQLGRVALRKENRIPDTLIFTEHPPVYTIGVRRGADSHLIWSEETLQTKGIKLHRTRRGGDITFHGPGQIVGYPIVALEGPRRDLHRYLHILESTVIATLAELGLDADRRERMTGVWIEKRKICAIGVGVTQWITYHGFALNVSTDLSYFDGIVPCGITDGTVTSIAQESGKEIDAEEVKKILVTQFNRRFYNTDLS